MEVERVSIAGISGQPRTATVRINDSTSYDVDVRQEGNAYVIQPNVRVYDSWTVTLSF